MVGLSDHPASAHSVAAKQFLRTGFWRLPTVPDILSTAAGPEARIAQRCGRSASMRSLAMAIDKVIAPLLRVPLFCRLEAAAADGDRAPGRAHRLSGAAAPSPKRAQPGDGAYLIVSGEAVRMPESRSRAAEPIEPGSLVGELAMLIDHVYGATVVAEGRVHCLKIMRSRTARADAGGPRPGRPLFQRLWWRADPGGARDAQHRPDACGAPRDPVHGRAARRSRQTRHLPRETGARALANASKEKRPTPGEELGARSASCA